MAGPFPALGMGPDTDCRAELLADQLALCWPSISGAVALTHPASGWSLLILHSLYNQISGIFFQLIETPQRARRKQGHADLFLLCAHGMEASAVEIRTLAHFLLA